MVTPVSGKLIKQAERLFTVRPRSAAVPPSDWGGAGNRGSRAKIRLLSSDKTSEQKRRLENLPGFSSSNIRDHLIDQMLNRDPGAGFSDFLLTTVSVNLSEKAQITQTFGDTETVYYFGKAPIIVNLGGMLIDDLDNQWFTSFVESYTHIMRGSELARNYELVELVLPNMVIIGTVMGFSYQQDASRDTDIPFSMQVHAKELRPLAVQIPAYAFTPESQLIDFQKATHYKDFQSLTKINARKQKIQSLADKVKNPLSSISDLRENINEFGTLGDFGFDGPVTGTDLVGQKTGGDIGNALGSTSLDLSGPGFDTPDSGATATQDISGARSNTGVSNSPNVGSLSSTTASLASFRVSLFSPVFGVLTSITKVVKTVTGDISKIISSFTNPVNNVLRDIQGIASQAIALAHLAEKSVTDIVNIPLRTVNEIRNTITALRNAKGVISRIPETISQSIKRLTKLGSLKSGAGFLTKGGSNSTSKITLLNSGRPYTSAGSAHL